MNRAYALLEIKSISDDERVIHGIASTPTADRMGDIVDSKGAVFKLPLPLLWQHNASHPIGMVEEANVTSSGISIKARIAKGVLPMIDEAWALIKAGLVRGLSIGFNPLKDGVERIEGSKDGRLFKSWEWLELSCVTIAANQDASIQMIKSIDSQYGKPASGDMRANRVVTAPGVAGNKTPQSLRGNKMKTIAEQLQGFEAKRQASAARMNDIMSKSADEGRTLDDEETEEYDGLQSEVKSVDEHLVRLRAHEKTMKETATPVSEAKTVDDAIVVRGGGIISVKSNVPKGTAYTRYAIALARSHGNLLQAAEIAKGWHDSTPEVELVLRAAVAVGTTTDATWAKPLVNYVNMANEFVELLRPATIVGRIPGLRRIPFNVRMPRATAGSTANWVGEGAPKPVSRMSFDTMTMPFTKVASIVVLTEELVRFSSPSAEAVVQADMIAAISQFIDQQFIDPAIAVNGTISPASITNGAPSVASSGPTIANVTADMAALMAGFITSNITAGVWIMHPSTALALSTLRTPQDIYVFPDIKLNGGTFFGLPVITSTNVPSLVGPPVTKIIVLLDASEIFLADDGGVTLDVSREASLQMDGAPSAGAAASVSLWQNNMVGLRAEREINWQRRRNEAVAVLTAVAY